MLNESELEGVPVPKIKVLKKVRFVYEVLSELDEHPEQADLVTLADQCLNGGWSGHFVNTHVEELDFDKAVEACRNHGTDPEFFRLADELEHEGQG